jgi:hypothetical protein
MHGAIRRFAPCAWGQSCVSAARRAPHESDGTTVATVFDPGGAAIAPAQHASDAQRAA